MQRNEFVEHVSCSIVKGRYYHVEIIPETNWQCDDYDGPAITVKVYFVGNSSTQNYPPQYAPKDRLRIREAEDRLWEKYNLSYVNN